ncbi:multidrug effflux MFS transporter [Nocardia aurantia]|uniref:Bicyclomycin resistance protein n=1 Tax=Nocardia aurantia TaxID=2585199 RepID=A0A7K0DK10_9NOCA|nr:multidrug effflux MFS transporter [Nocardia aurantia]MQY26146.1 Bicyclomycin resistance protein [Nocardia aurantia]
MTDITVPARQSSPGTASRTGAGLILVLGSLSMLAPLSMDMYLPAFPRMAGDLATGNDRIRLTLTACLLGLAAGQLLAGPLSDSFGRRRPLLIGMSGYLLSTILCACAPNAEVLIGARFAQGLTGAAGVVLARAIVRDLFQGLAAARFYSSLMAVSALAPILAPVVGGLVLRVTGWRGVFVLLAVLGAAMLVACARTVRETLPAEQRIRGGLRRSAAAASALVCDTRFTGYLLTQSSAFAVMFCYVSGFSFVAQDIYRVTPTGYSLLFGLNAVGLAVTSQINGRLLLGRVPSHVVLGSGLLLLLASAGTLPIAVHCDAGLPWIAGLLFLSVSAMGLILSTSTSLALDRAATAAGTGSALLGAAQFGAAALSPILISFGSGATAAPMAVAMAALAATSILIFCTVVRPWRRLPGAG